MQVKPWVKHSPSQPAIDLTNVRDLQILAPLQSRLRRRCDGCARTNYPSVPRRAPHDASVYTLVRCRAVPFDQRANFVAAAKHPCNTSSRSKRTYDDGEN